MTELLSGAALTDVLERWRGERLPLELVSPWITAAGTSFIQSCCEAGVPVRVTFRIPRAHDLPELWDFPGLLRCQALGAHIEGVDVRWGLHGKVYVADERQAIVGSANLTGPGLGGANLLEGGDLQANLELSTLLTDLERVAEVVAWVDGLPRHPVSRAHLRRLQDWAVTAAQRSAEPSAPVLTLASAHMALVQGAAAILRGHEVVGEVEIATERRAYVLYITDEAGQRHRVPVHTSVESGDQPYFHFELRDWEVPWVRTRRRKGQRTGQGTLFLPVREADDGLRPHPDLPLVWVRFDALAQALGAADRERLFSGAKKPKCYLERDASGSGWQLRIPRLRDRLIPLHCAQGVARIAG